MMLPADNLHLSNTGIKRLLGNLRLSDMASRELENDITNKWKHSHQSSPMPNTWNKGAPPQILKQPARPRHVDSIQVQQHMKRPLPP